MKTSLAILRDSILLALGLTVIFTLARENLTSTQMLYIFGDVLVYTLTMMYLAHGILTRVANLVCDQSEAVQWSVFVGGIIIVSAAGSLIGSLIVIALGFESGQSLTALFGQSFKVCAIVALMVGVNEVAFDRIRGQLEDTRLKLRTEELERERAMKLLTEAQLGALESRLHPHFLFNTLNSISSLIPTNPERAERLVERMAALLRFSLESHQGGLVLVNQEMKIVHDYLEIEQARLGGRLRYRLETNGDLEGLKIPPLSVQTLVENSIKHAVAPNRDGGEVRVRADRSDGFLQVCVADTGSGFSLEGAPPGHGLDNLRGRLTALFGKAAQLTVSRAEGWTTVKMKVPV